MKMYRDEADDHPKDGFDEYSTRDKPRQTSSFDRYGYDERDGPPEENDEEEGDNEPWGKSDPRRW